MPLRRGTAHTAIRRLPYPQLHQERAPELPFALSTDYKRGAPHPCDQAHAPTRVYAEARRNLLKFRARRTRRFCRPVLANHKALIRKERPAASIAECGRYCLDAVTLRVTNDRKLIPAVLALCQLPRNEVCTCWTSLSACRRPKLSEIGRISAELRIVLSLRCVDGLDFPNSRRFLRLHSVLVQFGSRNRGKNQNDRNHDQ